MSELRVRTSQIVLTLIVGFFTGVLSGMFGVGGAVVSTPAIRALGATPLEAVGSTLPVDHPVARSAGRCATAATGSSTGGSSSGPRSSASVAAVGGALLVDVVPGDGHLADDRSPPALARASPRSGSAQSPQRPEPEPTPRSRDRARTRTPSARAGASAATSGGGSPSIGLAAGLLSGLLGVGGGILMVPAFAELGPAADQGGGRHARSRASAILAVPGHDHARAPRPHRLVVRAPALHRRDPRRARSARTSRSGRRTATLRLVGRRSCSASIAVVYAVGEIVAPAR